jgi:hypothetical protein
MPFLGTAAARTVQSGNSCGRSRPPARHHLYIFTYLQRAPGCVALCLSLSPLIKSQTLLPKPCSVSYATWRHMTVADRSNKNGGTFKFQRKNKSEFMVFTSLNGARGGTVGWGTALQAGRSRVRFQMVSVEFFFDNNPSGRATVMGSTQPLIEMNASNIFWVGKGGRCVELISLLLSCADFHEIWEPQRPGTLRVCPGL